MLKIDVRADLRRVAFELDALGSNIAGKAAARALNRAAVTVRARASREVRKVYNLPSAEIKGQMGLQRATPGRLTSAVNVRGRPIALWKFGGRRLKDSAASVKVLRAGARKVVRGRPELAGQAFVATMRSGFTGIFQRRTGRRLPIVHLTSISLPGAVTQDRVYKVLEEVGVEEFQKNLTREIRFRLGR